MTVTRTRVPHHPSRCPICRSRPRWIALALAWSIYGALLAELVHWLLFAGLLVWDSVYGGVDPYLGIGLLLCSPHALLWGAIAGFVAALWRHRF